MKKILILAYDFPPYTSVGGQRPYSFYTHFKKYGYEPIVVTRHWDVPIKNQNDTFKSTVAQEVTVENSEKGTIIRVPYKSTMRDKLLINHGNNSYKILRKILSLIQLIGQFYSSWFDARLNIYKAANNYLKENKVDCIIASGEPFVLFRYAHLLSKKYTVPWVADYRDGWHDNHIPFQHNFIRNLRRAVELSREKKFMSNVSFIISVSDVLADKISITANKKGYLLPNGVEVSYYNKPVKEKDKFRIVYTGTIYDVNYVEQFAEGFEKFIAAYPEAKFEVLFIGITLSINPTVNKILALQKKYPTIIKLIDRVNAEEAAAYQLSASLLLSLIPGSQSQGIIGAKSYSYAATKIPILLIPSEPGTHTTFFPGRDIQHFAFNGEEAFQIMQHFYLKYLNGEEIKTSITDEEIFEISRECQVKKLAELIDKIKN